MYWFLPMVSKQTFVYNEKKNNDRFTFNIWVLNRQRCV